ncbi:MAG: hypothetical protein GF387_01660 [Candidatus Portnoybacteria bacterium]|nr:hypothetical protein [Candidatus Portnoybacteria bacterium]
MSTLKRFNISLGYFMRRVENSTGLVVAFFILVIASFPVFVFGALYFSMFVFESMYGVLILGSLIVIFLYFFLGKYLGLISKKYNVPKNNWKVAVYEARKILEKEPKYIYKVEKMILKAEISKKPGKLPTFISSYKNVSEENREKVNKLRNQLNEVEGRINFSEEFLKTLL